MANFQQIILFISIVIFIFSLVFIGIMLKYSENKGNWPPILAECPDYWMIDGSGNNAICVNVKDLGTCPPMNGDKHLKVNFNTPVFTGSNELCAKYTFAKKCGISWDGITYGTNNPCQTNE